MSRKQLFLGGVSQSLRCFQTEELEDAKGLKAVELKDIRVAGVASEPMSGSVSGWGAESPRWSTGIS